MIFYDIIITKKYSHFNFLCFLTNSNHSSIGITYTTFPNQERNQHWKWTINMWFDVQRKIICRRNGENSLVANIYHANIHSCSPYFVLSAFSIHLNLLRMPLVFLRIWWWQRFHCLSSYQSFPSLMHYISITFKTS